MTKITKKLAQSAVTSSMPKTVAPGGPTLVAKLRKDLGLSRKAFSRLTGYSERAIAGWFLESGVAS